MNINLDDYNVLEQKDLTVLAQHIQKVLDDRDAKIVTAIEQKDLNALKNSLVHNKDRILPEKAWRALNLTKMKIEDLDFFLYLTELPEYKSVDDLGHNLTKTKSAIYASLFDGKLFDFFLSKQELFHLIKEVVEDYGSDKTIPKENVKKIFENELLELDQILINDVTVNKKLNFLEYLFENNLIELPNEQLKSLYLKNWNESNELLYSLITNKFPGYKDITLNELINKVEALNVSKGSFYEKVDYFLRLNDNIFIRTIENHPMIEDDIRNLLVAFNKLSPNQDKKFHKFVDIILKNFPEHIENLKDRNFVIKSAFKDSYEKAMNYIDLNINLENKEPLKNKKIKM
jgi:hypothetical protein